MTQQNAQIQALVSEVARAWDALKAERKGAEARVRASIETEVAQAIAAKRSKVSEALRVALEGGATKVALKAVTTKDRKSFDALVPQPEVPEEIPEPTLADRLSWEWAGKSLRVTLVPTVETAEPWDLSDPRCWTGEFALFTRPRDNGVMLMRDAAPWPNGFAVAEWLFNHPEDDSAIIEMALANRP